MKPSGPASRSSHRALISCDRSFARAALSGDEASILASRAFKSLNHRELSGSGDSAFPAPEDALRRLTAENVPGVDASRKGDEARAQSGARRVSCIMFLGLGAAGSYD